MPLASSSSRNPITLRSVLKCCCRGLLSAMLARSPDWPKTEVARRYSVDIPSKVVVYGCMGFRCAAGE